MNQSAERSQVDRIHILVVLFFLRRFQNHRMLAEARVVVVVAGMEGALPSVVGGLVSVPVIAVPTSIGYGASFGGDSQILADNEFTQCNG